MGQQKEKAEYPLRFGSKSEMEEAKEIAKKTNRSLNSYILTLFRQDRQRQRGETPSDGPSESGGGRTDGL